MVAPNLPMAELNPNPNVLFKVPQDSVVQGQSIWKHIFIKSLQIEENTTRGLKKKRRCMQALAKKKYFKLFFLPNQSLSTRKIEMRKLGISPRTVRVQEVKDLLFLPKMNGRTTNCPKYITFIENQATDRHIVVRKQQLLNNVEISALSFPQKVFSQQRVTYYFYSTDIFKFWPGLLVSIILSMMAQDYSRRFDPIRNRGDSCMTVKDPTKTNRLGMQLQIIMALQFPDVKVSRKIQARTRPQSLPKDTQKFRKRIPFPRN